MNKLFKSILLTLGLLLAGGLQAQPAGAVGTDDADLFPDGAMPLLGEEAVGFASVSSCYIPWLDGIVLIDSVECSVHILVREGDSLRCYGTYVTDQFKGRHDLKKIVRPKSVGLLDDCIVLLASSAGDSSFLALLPFDVIAENAEMQPSAFIGFSNSSYAFQILPASNEILVMGKNPLGYDINYVSYDSFDSLALSSHYHYHVPRQAERIQSSDPAGVGLTVVAVVVVFLLLACICFIMKGFAAGVTKVQNRHSGSKGATAAESKTPAKAGNSEEVYAAIAAAIYAYNEELHDEENTVITIQKVERSWTPWNAKFYNMNQYFNNRR